MRIVFFGTPDYAVPCLQALVENSYDVIAVICQPDKPQGRKMVMTPPEVKVEALKHNIEVIQPEILKTPEMVAKLKELKPDLYVTCAYGKIISQEMLDIPKYGCINVHGSLLPKYRGAGPIQWAVINGEKQSGVTTMYTDAGMDTGDMLLKSYVDIPIDMNAGELFDILKQKGAELLIETLVKLEKGELEPIKQNETEATYAPMLKKTDGKIDFNNSAEFIHNIIRGCFPWPGAYIDGESKIKVLKSKIVEVAALDAVGMMPGDIVKAIKGRLVVKCGKGYIELLEVQPQSKKAMNGASFLNGHKDLERF